MLAITSIRRPHKSRPYRRKPNGRKNIGSESPSQITAAESIPPDCLESWGCTFASTAVFAPAVLRADNLVINVGHISPKTGPMAGFAEAQDWTLDGVRKALEPGLQIGGKTYKVEFITKDSQTDESRTAELANELILKDKVDIITASAGSINCNPTANVAELNEVPCITTNNPW